MISMFNSATSTLQIGETLKSPVIDPLFAYCDHKERDLIIKRIFQATNKIPEDLNEVLNGIFHHHFKITIYDVSLLNKLKQGILDHSAINKKTSFVEQQIVNKLDSLILEKAVFPLYNLIPEIIAMVISYLSLTQLANLFLAASVKKSSNDSQGVCSNEKFNKNKRVEYINYIKPVLYNFPWLILNTTEHPQKKAHVYQKFSYQLMHEKNFEVLKIVFSALQNPNFRIIRHHYLTEIQDTHLYEAFVIDESPKDNALSFNIAASAFQSETYSLLGFSRILESETYLINWKKLINAYSNVNKLSITTSLNDRWNVYSRKRSLFKLFKLLKNVNFLELNIFELTQKVSKTYDFQIQYLKKFISQFNQLESLVLQCNRNADIFTSHKDLALNVQASAFLISIPSRVSEAELQIFHLKNNLLKILHPNLKIKQIQVDIDCLDQTTIQCIERHYKKISQIYPVPYLTTLIDFVIDAFQNQHLSKIQLIFPISSTSAFIEKITPSFPQLQDLGINLETHLTNKKIIFSFKKLKKNAELT